MSQDSSLTQSGHSIRQPLTAYTMTIGRQKHNLRSPDVLSRAVAVGHHRLKLLAVGDTQLNVGSLVHSSDSHTRICQRIPKRIEMSDFVH